MKSKILFLSPYFPYPPHDGGKVRIYNLLKYLSEKNNLYFLSFIDSPEAINYLPGLEKHCKEVHVIFRNKENRIKGREIPRSVSFFYTPEMVAKLEEVVQQVKPDLIQIDFLIMTKYVEHISKIPVLYVEHDMSILDFNKSFHDRDLDEKARHIEWLKLIRYKKRILNKFHSIIVLTERDKTILSEFMPSSKLFLVPTGVDVEKYRISRDHKIKENSIIYIGHYRHFPNYEAVLYFINSIFPLILKKIPDAVFYVVGSGMTDGIFRYNSGNIKVIGEVDDIRVYLKKAKVFVCPVNLGGGVKGKVLEAMACGIPVVATRESSRGIKCTAGKDILVAENEADFALKTGKLLTDEKLNARIAKEARGLIEKNYDWRKISSKLSNYYEDIIRK